MFYKLQKIQAFRTVSNTIFRNFYKESRILNGVGTSKLCKYQDLRFYSKEEKVNDCLKPDKKPVLCRTSPNTSRLPCNPIPPKKGHWEDVDKQWPQKFKKYLIFGSLFTAATLYGLISYYRQKEPEKISKKEVRAFVRPKKKCKCPENGSEFPKHVPYVLVGGGTASFAAFRAIKSIDPQARVLVISNECNYPYMRPPLSKEMWYDDVKAAAHKLEFFQWNGTERSLLYEPEYFYLPVGSLLKEENGGVAVARGWSVKRIDAFNKKLYLEDDTEIGYDKCLLATGASPKNLMVFENAAQKIKDKVTLYRDIFDFQELTEISRKASAIAIIGGGFLGSELACALGKFGKRTEKNLQVYQIFREKGVMAHVLPEYLSMWTTDKVENEGVQVVRNTIVEDASLDEDNKLNLHLSSGKTLTVDHAIVSVGVRPNTDLAAVSDLEVHPELGGYLVNTEMEARTGLYVAGDCSCFYDARLGRRRVEHHDHAVVSGRLAGENMAGLNKPYTHQSMFWSDLGPDIGYEAIGIVDSRLPTVSVFAKTEDTETTSETKPTSAKGHLEQVNLKSDDDSETEKETKYNKGVVFYLKDDTIVGIVLWNIFNRMSVARQVLKEEKKYEDLNEVAKLFNIHEEPNSVQENVSQ